jgi:hypothetical protein
MPHGEHMNSERQKLWNEVRAEAYEVSLGRHIVASVEKPAPAASLPPTDAELRQREIERGRSTLNELIDARIEAAFEVRDWQHQATLDAVGDALGKIREQLRAEFAAEIGSLRADMTIERAHAADGVRRDVIDLPSVRRG